MTVSEVLICAMRRGIVLWADQASGRVKFEPVHRMDDELRAGILSCKAELLTLLPNDPPEPAMLSPPLARSQH